MIRNAWGSPRTTLSGALSLSLGTILSQLVPQLAAYFGAQPGMIWPLVGLVLGFVPSLFMSDTKKLAVPGAVTLLLLAGLLFPAPARAQVPTRTFGGCSATGSFCYGPSATLTLAGMDLSSGQFIAGIVPGAGYGVTFFADKPYQLGVGGYAAIQIAPETTTGMFSAIVSFAEYVRVGVGRQIIGGDQHRTLILLGLGADLK